MTGATTVTRQPAAAEQGDAAPEQREPLRKIIHIDMDAFYASVEQRDDPGLRGLPVAVGGARERGVVAAASYEARRYGVRSAMPSVTARRKCPELIFVKPRFEVYRAISRQIREVFARYTPLIEPLSLDEAYLDVTENLKGLPSATHIAQEIRAAIRAETGLTASAGVSYNKFLAKLASDQRKPDGLFVITPAQGPAFVEDLPVGRFHGVGPATTAKMQGLGLHSGRDLRGCSLAFLQAHFGKAGPHYYWISRGIDRRPVKPDRVRKSLGAENTFFEDLYTPQDLRAALQPILDKVWKHCDQAGLRGRTVTLKVKYADFRQITRSRTLLQPVASRAELEAVSFALLSALLPVPKGVRLLGVTLSSLLTPAEDTDREGLLLL
ncbi:DNA polymerase IV [Aquibaculum arenosum]|uniref:DNA polymerase IV n=1 Tax=Aquibaculum arenosum TaxID=3032591 RepID=UPI003F584E18